MKAQVASSPPEARGSQVNDMAAFVRSVELGGFSAAARALGLTPSAISKLVTRLEDRLGVRLLNRTTRKLALTPEGEAFLYRSRRILADIAEAEGEVSRFRVHPRGLLRINVGTAFGLPQLSPALPEFLARYPEVQVELTVNDRIVDLIEDGSDLGIRFGVLADSSLVSRKITEMERVICASPAYLRKHGTPARPEDLLEHNCLRLADHPSLWRWPFDSPEGVRTVEVTGNVLANNAETLMRLALEGVGIVRLVDAVVGEPIRDGRLVAILEDSHHAEPLPLSVVYPQGRHRSPKVAAMVEFLVEKFSDAPWRSSRKAAR